MDEQAKVITRMREELAARERERAVEDEERRTTRELLEQCQRDETIRKMRGACEKLLGNEMLDALRIQVVRTGIKFAYRGRETFWQITEWRAGEPEYREMTETAIIRFCDETDELWAAGDELIARFKAAQMLAEFQAVNSDVPWNLEDYVHEDAQAAWVRIEAVEAERERRRVELEEEAFYPFVYYRVYNAIVMVASDEEDERIVDYEVLDSLTDKCDMGGWWHSARPFDRAVRLANVFKVERVAVMNVDGLPTWCPRRDTEFGEIKIPPMEAVRI